MGPKKGRPKKVAASDNPDEQGDPPTDAPLPTRVTRSRPTRKNSIVDSTSSSLPSIENVPVAKKTTRARGRKRVPVNKEVLCSSNSDMQLRSQISSNSADFESSAESGKEVLSNDAVDNQNCSNDEGSHQSDSQICDSSDKTEDKSNKENSFTTNDDENKAPEKVEMVDQAKDFESSASVQDPVVSTPFQEESTSLPVQFFPGDMPLKKRRLRDLVVRDQEGFLIPTPAATLNSPSLSASLTPQIDFPAEVQKRLIGAHVITSGGLDQAVYKANSCDYQAMGLFVKDLGSWLAKTNISEDDVAKFQKALDDCGFCVSNIVARGSYIIEVCSPESNVRRASSECIVDDIKRCSLLGISNYTIHLSESDPDVEREVCIKRITGAINSIHQRTSSVVTILENTCGGEFSVGSSLDDFKKFLDGVEDKSRIGFAVDTCHLLSSGVDITTKGVFETWLQEFQEKIGLKYLKVIYVNDSGGELDSHVDEHLSIGQGKIGLEFFEMLVNHPELLKIPMILETPIAEHQVDHQLLNSLIH